MGELLLSAITGGSAAALILGFLMRSWIKHGLSKALERHRSILNKENSEHQTRFNVLQNKRVEVIAEVYGLLVGAHQAAKRMIPHKNNPSDPKSEATAGIELSKALRQFDEVYSKNRIWLPEKLCTEIDSFKKSLSWETTVYLLLKIMDQRKELPEGWGNDLRETTWKKFHEEIPEVLESLNLEFRDIIGG